MEYSEYEKYIFTIKLIFHSYWQDLIYSYYIGFEKSVDIGMFVYKFCKITNNIRDNNETITVVHIYVYTIN